ncbi:hypothetical protein Tco_0977488 [Tanacetum coccineum]|uniref:Monopolin complex subunit Csm1/Pcs1 C-terminal domain-containing protein n=1 Tax=Tanacetum coccineum TaxID=301880 RepID=A0ABQ5EK92_9ASTR
MVVQAPPPPTIIPSPPTTSITTLPTTTTVTTSTTPPPTTSPTKTSTLTIPTTSTQPSQPRKQRIRRRRDTEVTQASEPTVFDDDTVPNKSNDLLSREDRLQLTELMNLYTTLQTKVLELEKTKSSQQLKIESLERKVKKLEMDKNKRTHKLERLYKVGLSARVVSSDDEKPSFDVQEDEFKQGRRISDIDDDADITLVDEGEGRNEEIFDAERDLAGEEVVVEEVMVEKVVVEKKIVEEEILNKDEATLAQTLADIPKVKNLDKGKGKMDEIEKPVKLSRKEQITEEQEELTIKEKSRLFVELMEKRKKHFAAKRAEEKRSKPLSKAQKRKFMSTYLKNMAAMDSEVLEGSSKRAGDELENEAKKKQKKDDDEEIAKLQTLIEIVPNEEEVAINAIPLASKSPVIIDYAIYKEGRVVYYKITRAGTGERYILYRVFSQLLQSFYREDLETLWKLVKERQGEIRPTEGYERVLWEDLKVIFEPHVKDLVWRELRQGTVLT